MTWTVDKLVRLYYFKGKGFSENLIIVFEETKILQ